MSFSLIYPDHKYNPTSTHPGSVYESDKGDLASLSQVGLVVLLQFPCLCYSVPVISSFLLSIQCDKSVTAHMGKRVHSITSATQCTRRGMDVRKSKKLVNEESTQGTFLD